MPNLTPEQLASFTPEQLAIVQQLQAKLAEKNQVKITKIKVSDKGAVSVYGMGRFPVTLYAAAWEAILADGGKKILDFIKANESSLSRKSDD